MNNDLISRSELKKAFDKWWGCEDIPSSVVEDLIDEAPTVEAKTTAECMIAYGDGFESARRLFERPHGESISLEDGLKKARRGKYVIYDVDFLLDNLAREVNIMENARQWKELKENDND